MFSIVVEKYEFLYNRDFYDDDNIKAVNYNFPWAPKSQIPGLIIILLIYH